MREDNTDIWVYIFMIIFVSALNFMFKDQSGKRKHRNLYQHEVERYDSLVVQEIDSLLTTTYK